MSIHLVGTSHVSRTSHRQIKAAIEEHKPNLIAVELDPDRLDYLLGKKRRKSSPLRAIRAIGLKGFLFGTTAKAAQSVIGKMIRIQPGQDMLNAVKLAQKNNVQIALIDQPIATTLKKISKRLKRKELVTIFKDIIWGTLMPKRYAKKIGLKELSLDNPSKDAVRAAIEYIQLRTPTLYEVLVEERNHYMVDQLTKYEEKGYNIVAVVGAGHVGGMEELLEKRVTFNLAGIDQSLTIE